MLTRSKVARRIGRSIATVRKMEGHSLHPVQGLNGVHIFDEDEVERVARRIRKTGRALWRPAANGSRPYEYEPVDWDLVNEKAQEMLAGSRARIVDQIQTKERVGKRPSEAIDLDAELRTLIDGLDHDELEVGDDCT